MLCNQQDLQRPDNVVSLQLSIKGIDNVDGISSEMGSMILLSNGPAVFIPFEDLTEAQVNTWVETSAQYNEAKEYITQNIVHTRNPPVIERMPPWFVAPEPTPQP